MKRTIVLLLGVLMLSTAILSSCGSQSSCAAYSTYAKKKGRSR